MPDARHRKLLRAVFDGRQTVDALILEAAAAGLITVDDERRVVEPATSTRLSRLARLLAECETIDPTVVEAFRLGLLEVKANDPVDPRRVIVSAKGYDWLQTIGAFDRKNAIALRDVPQLLRPPDTSPATKPRRDGRLFDPH